MLAFGLIDSAGQALYTAPVVVRRHAAQLLGTIYGFLVAAGPFVHWVITNLADGRKRRHLPVSLNLLAAVGAVGVITPVLLGLDLFAHAIACDFQQPVYPRELLMPAVALVVAIIFSYCAGGGRRKGTSGAMVFLNRTSLHPIYTSRLIRAYLGAS